MPAAALHPITRCRALYAILAVLATSAPAVAEKIGMPDLPQVDQTCLPTATANLIIWFGRHGYPKLLVAGSTTDDSELRTVHEIMQATNARFDLGTRMDAVTDGIRKYIRDAGYSGDVEYRGLGGAGPDFTQEWLQRNDDDHRGFILVLAYCHWDPASEVAIPVIGTGHAVTLVSARPDLLLVHDPAHENDETGRKILTPTPITDGTWVSTGGSASIAGLLFLSGSLLDAPEHSRVLLMGAVCVTMRPANEKTPGSLPAALTIGGPNPSAAPSPTPASTEPWWSRLYHDLF